MHFVAEISRRSRTCSKRNATWRRFGENCSKYRTGIVAKSLLAYTCDKGCTGERNKNCTKNGMCKRAFKLRAENHNLLGDKWRKNEQSLDSGKLSSATRLASGNGISSQIPGTYGNCNNSTTDYTEVHVKHSLIFETPESDAKQTSSRCKSLAGNVNQLTITRSLSVLIPSVARSLNRTG